MCVRLGSLVDLAITVASLGQHDILSGLGCVPRHGMRGNRFG